MLTPGTHLGPYVVTSPLGQGGMGEVYRAHDPRLKRDVALKVLPASFASDADRLARFEREAQVLASLNHPLIAAIHGVEDSGSAPALVMELVDGPTLADRLAGGAIPVDEAILIARQIAEAIEAAHEAGIIHRDLKPANVKVRPDGTVKVLDFGLAKAWESEGRAGSPEHLPTITSPAMTHAGMILGTAAYMAPEQARGKPLDKRVDIWAFGCVLYEMLSGKRAFGGDNVTDTLTAVLRDALDWTALPASTPLGIRRVLTRCLERDPKTRLRDIGDARLELDAALDEEGAPTPVRPRDNHGGWFAGAAWLGLGAIISAVGVGLWLHHPPRSADVTRLALALPSDLGVRMDPDVPDLAMSADGRRIIYASRRTDPEGARIAASQLISRSLEAFEVSPYENLGFSPRSQFMSPDGAWIGFETTVGDTLQPVLAKIPATGGAMSVITNLGSLDSLRGANWTSDNRIVFATAQRATGLFEVPAAGGTPKPLTTADGSRHERDHYWPEVLPSNAGTLFSIVYDDGHFDVGVLPAGESKWRVLVPGALVAHYLPSGHLVYVLGSVLYGVGFDLRTLRITTQPVALVDGVLTKGSGAADLAIARTGESLAYVAGTLRDSTRRLVWLDRDGNVSRLPLEDGGYQNARLSPDGRRVAVVVQNHGLQNIWLYDVERDSFTRLTPREESVSNALWSPDGHRLAFWSRSAKGLFIVGVDGSDRTGPLATAENGELYPNAWSPNGETIAFIRERPDLNLFGVSTSAPYTVRPLAIGTGAQVEAAFSPNGRWLAHVAFDGRVPEIVVGPGGDATRYWPVAPSGRNPLWTQDGREVIYLEKGAIHHVPIDSATGMPAGRPGKLVDLPSTVSMTGRFDMSKDGRRFLMIQRVEGENRPAEIRVVLNWAEDVRAKIAGAAPVSNKTQ